MLRSVALVIALASTAHAKGAPEARIGAMVGLQKTDRSAWVFGPSLELTILDPISLRGEAQLELGDLDSPFGKSNILDGDGPHVNHVMFGPVWRPREYARYGLALGAEAGHMLGPLFFALQIRFDASAKIDMAGPEGQDVQTNSGRVNFVIEFPLDVR